MCGICGIVQKDLKRKPEASTLEAMNHVLQHRGPDAGNLYLNEGVGLGHRRLSIIDLSGGAQPMANEDGSLRVTFNGEIYNFQELRGDLVSKGYRFKTRSDTEVILHHYAEKGPRCVDDFRGMYAFAVWDSRRKELFAARDRLGKKPFFYSVRNGDLYFASEIKSILQVPGFPREVEPDSVAAYFSYTYIPYPKTAYRHILELPPAHTLVYKEGDLKTECYWRPSFKHKLNFSLDEICDRLWELLKEATRLRMISDVPLGAFLSGGIDSSIVVALMSELSSRPVKTFSIGFEEQVYNELPYARQIAQRYRTDHEEFVVRPDALEILPKLIWHYDQPFADSSALATFYVAKMARKRVTVALNGDGGDESFCGYPRFLGLIGWRMLEKIPMSVRKLLSGLSPLATSRDYSSQFMSRLQRFIKFMSQMTTRDRYFRLMIQFSEEERRQLFKRDFQNQFGVVQPEEFIDAAYKLDLFEDPLDGYTLVEYLTYLPGDLLTKMDRATMASSLEARSPFLDHKVVEFASSLPFSMKIKGFRLKHILKYMMRKRLPASILNRPKTGFSVPVSRWFKRELKDYIREVLLDPKTLARPYFNEAEIRRLLDHHQKGKEDHGHRLWTLLMFELWHREFIDRKPLL